MSENKKMSIKEIAELAGISTASVSRILNQKGRYSKETEKKVLQIVDKYGYTINTAAKSLRIEQTKTIALLIPDITNEFFSNIAFYCEQFFYNKGYSLFICNSRNHEDNEYTYFTEFVKKNVDGIIAVSFLNKIPKCLEMSNIPIVTLDRIASSNASIPAILTNEYDGAYQATQLLISKGCKNIIALIPSVTKEDADRTKGYLDALKENHLSHHSPIYMNVSENSGTESESLTLNLLNNDPTIDGIFCGSDRLALGALYACRRCHKDVPHDVKIIGFDNSAYSQLPSPSLSTIGRSSKRLAEKACQLLLDIIDKKETMSGQRIYEPIRLIQRDSTK